MVLMRFSEISTASVNMVWIAPLVLAVPPENPIGRRNRGFSDRDWIPSLACTRPSFFSSFQHSATASEGAQRSSLNSLLFGISLSR